MRIRALVDENFQDYKKCAMLIGTAFCDWKCCKECGEDLCQNMPLAQSPIIEVSNEEIAERYIKNELSSAIIFGGLEPFEQFEEMIFCIDTLRQYTDDDIVIYTGFYKEEIAEDLNYLATRFKNIIIKYGRFVPCDTCRYDEVLGVTLASQNQYAERIS
jgi:uncharacterized radical SAM superfamily protein